MSKVGTIPPIPKGIKSYVWATVVALACLDVKCSSAEYEWMLIYKKGIRYLRMAGYSNELLEDTEILIRRYPEISYYRNNELFAIFNRG